MKFTLPFELFPLESEPKSNLISEFLEANPELRLRSPRGVFVELVESLGYIELLIRINPDTSMNDLRYSGEWLLEWRDCVHNWNKERLSITWEDAGEHRLFQHLENLFENEGKSYKDLATLINTEIVDWINKSISYREKLVTLEGVKSGKDDINNHREIVGLRLSVSNSIANAELLLKTLGFPQNEINLWIATIYDEVKDGRFEPNLQDEPVDHIKVRNFLKYRRNKRNQGV